MNKEYKSFGEALAFGGILSNPVLVHCAGLCPVIVGTASLNDALMVSAELIVSLLVTCVIASALLKKVPRFIRVTIYLALGLLISFSELYIIENYTITELSLSMRILIPVIAVNSLTAVHAETYSVKHGVKSSVLDALASGIGASFVIVIVGILREIIGSGSVGGHEIGLSFTLDGMTLPFGCLITLGFLAAILNAISNSSQNNRDKNSVNTRPEEIEMEFEEENAPEETNLYLSEYEDLDYLLESTDEFLRSLTGGGDRE